MKDCFHSASGEPMHIKKVHRIKPCVCTRVRSHPSKPVHICCGCVKWVGGGLSVRTLAVRVESLVSFRVEFVLQKQFRISYVTQRKLLASTARSTAPLAPHKDTHYTQASG